MPLYEYKCLKCKRRFEIWQSFDHPPTARCPKCQGKAERVIHPTPFIFKESYKREAPE